MKSTRVLAFLLVPLAVFFVNSVSANDPAKSALLGNGKLTEVREPLGKIFQFSLEKGMLRLDRKSWRTDAKDADLGLPAGAVPPGAIVRPVNVAFSPLETLFRRIQTSAGISGAGSSSSTNSRSVYFNGREMNGRLDIRSESIRMSLDETQAPFRALEFTDDGQGGFRMQVTHPDGDMILLHQTRAGKFNGVAIVNGQVTAGQGDSFIQFVRQHRGQMDSRVLPVLGQFGIQPLQPVSSGKVRQAVLAQVLRRPETEALGRKLLVQLDGRKFDEREDATKRLSEQFENFKDLIQTHLSEKTTSLEVRSRLEKIVAEHGDSIPVNQTVAALDLTRDAGYLVSLLDHVSAKEAPRLADYLEKVTGQKLGTDPSAWKEWAKKNEK